MKKITTITCLFILFNTTFYSCLSQSLSERIKLTATEFKSSEGKIIKAVEGTFKVPENRSKNDTREITVDFIRLKSTSQNPKAPLIFLAGGPGNTSTYQAKNPDYLSEWLPYLEVSDVILYDQRGTKDEDLIWYWDGSFPEDFFVSSSAAGSHFKVMGVRALKAYEERGVDITGYTTKENVEDINELRLALGIEKYSILGFSYGTHLGLALLRKYGENINSAILAGVEGPNDTFDFPMELDNQFNYIADLADQSNVFDVETSGLQAALKRVMKKLDKKPMKVEVKSPLDGHDMRLKVGSFGLGLILRMDIGDASDLPVFPKLIYSIDKGDTEVLQWFVQKRMVMAYGIPGMSVMMDLASGATEAKWRQIEREVEESMFGNIANFPFYDLQFIWPEVELGVDYRTPVKSDVNTLFLSGAFDYNTPAESAEEVSKGFKNSKHIIVENAGHEQILSNQKVINVISEFLKGNDIGEVKAAYKELKFIPLSGAEGK